MWVQALDVMIPKKKESKKASDLRIIVLMDALFNLLNKRIARAAMQNAEIMDGIPPEVHGGRKDF